MKKSAIGFLLVATAAVSYASFQPRERAVPDFALERLDGSVIALSKFSGKVVLLFFWNSWTPGARAEFSAMEKAYNKFKDRDLVIIGVHRTRTEPQETAEEFVKASGVTFPILLDRTDGIYETYVSGGRTMPASVLIDRKNRVQEVIFGPTNPETMAEKMEKLL